MNKILTMAVLSLVLVAGVTTSVVGIFQTASARADTSSEHDHVTVNKNNFHNNIGSATNNDGDHTNSHCVTNSNNDKGSVCHNNSH